MHGDGAAGRTCNGDNIGRCVRGRTKDRAAQVGVHDQQIITRSGVGKSAYYAAKAGTRLPRASTLSEILRAAKVPAADAERLESARDRIDEQQRGRLPVHLLAAPVAPAALVARRSRARIPIAGLAFVVALVAVAGAGSSSGRHIATSHDPFPRLHLATAPSQQRWPDGDVHCERGQTWTKRFDDHYRGEVYVQLTPGSVDGPVNADLTLTWGHLHWRGVAVSVLPGALAKRQGGTLLLFVKKQSVDSDPTDWNPAVRLDTSTPVCAEFGTAGTRPLPTPSMLLETPGWTAV